MTDETARALERLKEVSEISQSSFVSQIMHQSVPTILQLCDSLERAKSEPVEALSMLKNMVDQAAHDANQASLDIDKGVNVIRRSRNASND